MKETIEAEIVEENKAVVLSEIKYPVSQIDLNTLLEEYKDIPEINPDADIDLVGEQYQFVLKGHKAFVKARTGIEKTRKQLKQPALDYGKNVDGIAKEFQSMIVATETKLQIQRKIVEDNEARKQREAEEVEELRIDNIKKSIADIRSLAGIHYNSNSEALTKALEALTVPTEEVYQEFLPDAREAQQISIMQLQEMRKSKVSAERVDELEAERNAEAEILQAEQDEKLRLEREEFEAQKEEFAKQQRQQQEVIRLQQEEIDKANADKEAEELASKQESEKVNRDKVEREKAQNQFNEACEDIEKLGVENSTEVVTAIFDGYIRNVKWEV